MRQSIGWSPLRAGCGGGRQTAATGESVVLWIGARHAQLTARIAEHIAHLSQQSSTVILAALLHHVTSWSRLHFTLALAPAEQEGKSLFEVEERLTQFSHAEVGAYVLSLGGLPFPIVAAMAHHHHPRARKLESGVDW
jgi:HD-like signal output (HDOD) protein